MLTRETILGYVDLGEEVQVPEWGGSVRVRGLTVAEWAELQVIQKASNGNGASVDGMAQMVVRCLIDEKGERLFTNEEAAVVARKGAVIVARLAIVCQRLSGLLETEEQGEKNS